MKILLSLFVIALFAVEVHGANPAFTDFNTNQFSTTGNKVAIKSGASVTNLTNNGSAVATMSTLVWTNDSGVIYPIGANYTNDDNRFKVFSPALGDYEVTANSQNGATEAQIRLEADTVDDEEAEINIRYDGGTENEINLKANLDSVRVQLNVDGDLRTQLDPTAVSGSGDPAYLLDTFSSQAAATDVLLSVRNLGTNEFQVDRLGAISLSAETNKLSIANDQLLLDGVPISGGTEEAPVNNFYSTNNFFISGKGNTLVITQQLTLNYMPTNILATDGSGVVTNAVIGSGLTWTPSTRTLTASGDTTFSNVVTLTMTGTNVSQMDFALVQGGGVFKLALIGNAYVGAPANVATSPFRKAWLIVQQPSTGTCLLQFTNGHFAWPERVSPVMDTNNGSVAVFQFISDVFTNGLLHGSMTPWSGLATNM